MVPPCYDLNVKWQPVRPVRERTVALAQRLGYAGLVWNFVYASTSAEAMPDRPGQTMPLGPRSGGGLQQLRRITLKVSSGEQFQGFMACKAVQEYDLVPPSHLFGALPFVLRISCCCAYRHPKGQLP